jgi:hypothetical protein
VDNDKEDDGNYDDDEGDHTTAEDDNCTREVYQCACRLSNFLPLNTLPILLSHSSSQPLRIYDSDDQEEPDRVDHGLCNRLLENKRNVDSVKNKMSKIIKLINGSAKSKENLHQWLMKEEIKFKDASSCTKLFIMFLTISGNVLLAELLTAGSHKGRNGNALASEDFKTIW